MKTEPRDTMTVRYHGSLQQYHGLYEAAPCECTMCRAFGYSRGWMLTPTGDNPSDRVLWDAGDQSITVLDVQETKIQSIERGKA